ncbi:MAG: hypothetical protein FWC09_02490 [Lachnospiraceae bacterium]|nr:hypothetical protein [Lachnospiraceae bacterium]
MIFLKSKKVSIVLILIYLLCFITSCKNLETNHEVVNEIKTDNNVIKEIEIDKTAIEEIKVEDTNFEEIDKMITEEIEPNLNAFFFIYDNVVIEYNGFFVPLSGNEIRQKTKLNIELIKEFDDGKLYTLMLDELNLYDMEDDDPFDQIPLENRMLGYFYITNEQIYRYLLPYDKIYADEENQNIVDKINTNKNDFINSCDIVCSNNGTSDVADEDGWHKYVEEDGNKRIFHIFNDYEGGTRYYEKIIWEENKGIIYYRSGTGAMRMHIEFAISIDLLMN